MKYETWKWGTVDAREKSEISAKACIFELKDIFSTCTCKTINSM